MKGKLIEKHIEKRLIKRVNENGGLCWKFTSPSFTSVPDRICLFWPGKIYFVECKAPGKKPTRRQAFIILLLNRLGFSARYVDTYESIEKFIAEL